jgi:hypothetical protein
MGSLPGSIGMAVLLLGLSPGVGQGLSVEMDRSTQGIGATSPSPELPDTVVLPAEWPEAFPSGPEGTSVAGVTLVDAERLRGTRAGPYFIVALNLPQSETEAFHHYREALRDAGWTLLEGLTNDGSRPGLVTIGFQGHGYGGDIRFQEVLGSLLATIHLYRDEPDW